MTPHPSSQPRGRSARKAALRTIQVRSVEFVGPEAAKKPAFMTRPRWLAVFFSLMLVGYGARFYDLQIRRYASFATQSENNFQRDEVVRALRGEIRTQDGLLLTSNRMAVDLIYKGGPVDGWERIRYLANVPADKQERGRPKEPNYKREREVTLARNIPQERIAALYEYTVGQPNLELRERLERVYPQGSLAAHLLGYTREADEQEVKEEGYTLGDLVGASGLEAGLQKQLAGQNGTRRVEVTANGQRQGDRIVDPGQKGQNITLSIDSTLQRAAEQTLKDALTDINKGRAKYGKPAEKVVKGAIIAIDPRTGEVLALASSPTYDPNWFSQSPRPKALVQALTSPDSPTMNRAVQQFDSGSVFKATSTLAYVEKWGDKVFDCPAGYLYGGRIWRNWAHYGMGPMDGAKAISTSCDTWYYQSALDAGPVPYSNYLAKRARDMGYGGPTGMELIGEKDGLVPSAAEYQKKGVTWYPGFSVNYSIGQGDLQVTPAQTALALMTILNDGQRRPLTLVHAVNGQRQPPKAPQGMGGTRATYELVKRGMAMTTQQGFGTASTVLGPRWFPVATGGKTGTAENAMSRTNGYAYTNAWYEGFGPLQNPNYEVVAMFQNGGEGYDVGLPAVTRMFAARWCLKLDERHHALPDQTPCLGELPDMHRALAKQAQQARAEAAKADER